MKNKAPGVSIPDAFFCGLQGVLCPKAVADKLAVYFYALLCHIMRSIFFLFQRSDRHDSHQRVCDKALIHLRSILFSKPAFCHREGFHQKTPQNTGQEAAGKRRCIKGSVFDEENIGSCPLTDFTAAVQKNKFIKTDRSGTALLKDTVSVIHTLMADQRRSLIAVHMAVSEPEAFPEMRSSVRVRAHREQVVCI